MTDIAASTDRLVSVIVPVFNAEKYLHKCINSILHQTYQKIELILIDDGSTDSSSKICDLYSQNDVRVKVIHQKNAGQAAARNRGIEESNGDFIMFADNDDYLDEKLIENLSDSIQITGADMAGGVLSFCDEGGKLYESLKPCVDVRKKQNNIDALMSYYTGNISGAWYIYVWGKLYRKSVFENIRFIEGIKWEDLQIMPHILLNCSTITFDNTVRYYYLQRSSSDGKDGKNADIKYKSSFIIWEDHLKLYRQELLPQFFSVCI